MRTGASLMLYPFRAQDPFCRDAELSCRAIFDSAGQFQQTIGQGGFTMVNMRDIQKFRMWSCSRSAIIYFTPGWLILYGAASSGASYNIPLLIKL